jgi:hypothetical protein
MSEYTPGPWTPGLCGAALNVQIKSDDGNTVAAIFSTNKNYRNQNANALLIAAAPDMLEAAELLLTNWPESRDGMDFEQLPVGVKSLRAAIAKAKGEQP